MNSREILEKVRTIEEKILYCGNNQYNIAWALANQLAKQLEQEQASGRPPTVIECEAMQAICILQDETKRLRRELRAAKKVIKVIDGMTEVGAFYDDDEGDCTFCGAEPYAEGYHHGPGCWANELETALRTYQEVIKQEN